MARGQLGLEVRRLLTCFYVDDGILASPDPTFLQDAFNKLVDLFERVGLRTNTTKTEAMTFLPGKIRQSLSEEAYAQRMEGLGTANPRARRVVCNKCGAELAEGSLPRHLLRRHDIHHQHVPPARADEAAEDEEERRWRARRDVSGWYDCPVPGCAAPMCRDFWALRRHFWSRHPTQLVECSWGGCPARCSACGMQTTERAFLRGHATSEVCRRMAEVKGQRRAAARSRAALEVSFTAYGRDTLRKTQLFKYLGRQVSYVDSDVPAMRANLKKARAVWARVSKILRGENVPPPVGGMFYRGIVMAVLLYGSETWCLPRTEVKALEGFHVAAARVLTGMRPKQARNGTWKYPSSEEVLKRARMHTIADYVGQRRAHIARKVSGRPVLGECKEAHRRRGSVPRAYWWEQDLDMELPDLVEEDAVEGDGPRRHTQRASGHDVLRRRQLRELEEEREERRRGAPPRNGG